MTEQGDPGLDAVEHVYAQMQIDDEWSVFEPRGFTWWGHHLAQRVWAERPRDSFGMDVVRVHAETRLVRDVQPGDETWKLLNFLNHDASLSSLVFDAARGTIVFECSVFVHEQNVEWLKWLFMHAVAIQAAEAGGRAALLARELEGEIDVSEHPSSGQRPEPDDMLNVIRDVYYPNSQAPPPLTQREFQAALDIGPRSDVLANAGDGGLTAEFPFLGDVPAIGMALGYRSADAAPESALLMMSIERYPRLGYGVLARLVLPNGACDRDQAEARLNLAETTNWTACHLLGGWCLSNLGLTFVTFVPTAACWPGVPVFLFQTMGSRVRWVRDEWMA